MILDKTNAVNLQGVVDSTPTFSHEVKGEQFYNFNLSVNRLSEEKDIIPITISSRLLNNIKLGDKLAIKGEFRSCNKLENGKSKLILYVFCQEIHEWNADANSNSIELDGYICKPPIFRNTPLSREICDVLLAVNRGRFNKSDYIPCIAWGRNAQFSSKLPVGTELKISGRIQSREYKKQIDGEEPVTKRAYEVSISNVSVIFLNEKVL